MIAQVFSEIIINNVHKLFINCLHNVIKLYTFKWYNKNKNKKGEKNESIL